MEDTKEILRKQLELLAERSKECDDKFLSQINKEMLKIAVYLDSSSRE